MIAGAGFALMAWELAQARVFMAPRYKSPLPRRVSSVLTPASNEYYRIIDNAWAAWNNEQLCAVAFAGIPVTVRL